MSTKEGDVPEPRHEKRHKGKQGKKERKMSNPDAVPRGKGRVRSMTMGPSVAALDFDPLTADLSSDANSEIESNPSKIVRMPGNYSPKADSVVCQSQASIPAMKNVSGYLILTNEALVFQTRQLRPGFVLKVKWEDVTETVKIHKKGVDKALKVVTENESIVFSSIKERETISFFVRLIMRSTKRNVKTYGFSKKDDAEVATRINVLRAAHVFEDSVPTSLKDIVQGLREDSLVHDMLTACGCTDIVISQWTKTKNGIQRRVQYVQPMSQNSDVSAVQTLMKSGNACVFEVTETFARVSVGKFLESNVQFYFKEDEGIVNFRGAYGLEWTQETWDKEFVEASVTRVNRMNFYFLKSKFSGESFNVSKYEGKWRMHQPFALVILSLLILILFVLFLPIDTDWYRIMAGFVVLGFFFSM